MWEILENEIKRQEDMDQRFKTLDEDQYKAFDEFNEEPVFVDPFKESAIPEEREKELRDLKDLEDTYHTEVNKILEEIKKEEEREV